MTHENPIISFAIIPSLDLLKMTQQSTDRACQCLQLILKIRSSTDQKILKRSSTVPLQILKSSSKGSRYTSKVLQKNLKSSSKYTESSQINIGAATTPVLVQHLCWCKTSAGATSVLVQHQCC